MKRSLFLGVLLLGTLSLWAEKNDFPVKGLCMNTPAKENVGKFCRFIEDELAPMGLNTLILRVDYNYEFESYPQMASKKALSKTDVKQLVDVCRKNRIRLIPLVDLLGHQSWASTMNRLLEVFPEFDETPYIDLPKSGDKPKNNGLYEGDYYCKSYCPLHPEVHTVLFRLLTEIIHVFETDVLHAGMDEVFYLGEYGCPRCCDKDKAELFAGEVNKLNRFAKSMGCELWIWGDRLLDGKVTGMGSWEASTNGTAPAIDLIDKEVLICDWHYERAELSAVYLASKGLRVATCPWRRPEVALQQLENTNLFRECSGRVMKERFVGLVETDWGSPEAFMEEYKKVKDGKPTEVNTAANTFYQLFKAMQ